MNKFNFFTPLFLISLVHGVEENVIVPGANPPTEWASYFTGPLLAPSGTVLPAGHYDVEAYLFYSVTNGRYDQHWRAHKTPNLYSLSPVFYGEVGLTEWMDVTSYLPFAYNWSHGQHDFGFEDAFIALGFQLWKDNATRWLPGVQLIATEFIPLGKYRRLDPDKNLTDLHGGGAWGTGLNLIFYKLLHIEQEHFVSLNLSLAYTHLYKAPVDGLNAYGGGFNTKGSVDPGDIYTAIFSFEYSFTRYWAVAMDTLYRHENKATFSGNPGCTACGTQATVGLASSELITLSPAIEYNFDQHLGIIAGIWFTVVGRNTDRFQSAVIAVNYFY